MIWPSEHMNYSLHTCHFSTLGPEGVSCDRAIVDTTQECMVTSLCMLQRDERGADEWRIEKWGEAEGYEEED